MIVDIVFILLIAALLNWTTSMQILNLTTDDPRTKKISVSIAILSSLSIGFLIYLIK